MKRILSIVALLALGATPAFAHPGHGLTDSFAAGVAHPLGGLDHMAVMIAVGLWAALKGGRALWIWPAAFVGVMLVGGALGMAMSRCRSSSPGILASVVALGLLVALAVDLPVAVGAGVVGAFALLHGHAHGSGSRGDHERHRIHGGLRARHRDLASHRHRLCANGDARANAAGDPRRAARLCVVDSGRAQRDSSWIRPTDVDAKNAMIPGEMFIKDGEIELNAGRKTVTDHGRQFGRPADPGRLALSFLRNQPGAEVRPQKGARHAARYRRRHRGALRAGSDARGHAGRARRQEDGLRIPQDVMGKL